MYLPYFGQDLESKKKVVGILAHVWGRAGRDVTGRACSGWDPGGAGLHGEGQGRAGQGRLGQGG